MNTNMKWQKVLGGIALATALAGASATTYAADMDFGGWDTNSSGIVEYNEWGTAYDNDGMFTDWDGDSDGVLSNDEYDRGLYNSYDADGSGDWNEDEFKTFQDDAGDGGWLDV
ncbi:MAG TPA: hypothetical protein ENI17_04530 [Pseudomonas xinjiangensis]|uniref:EF hand n=2 Tax=root TaxID=1 RepID=A0A7V1FS16_9GAMM|nr:hypothetical protein [Halopseudomonas xinjiangensis]HEC46875.1 hypothetical protein [Halopseudomonas xinjiangensis]